eukprot:TRINITY_DN142_c0_g1_i39.p1 TRINITY_DN142_c0_g1~~TRINITY_DN142_c0_g1_i39.p1  ORF type:complete len:190 (-),score=1.85 TRINITY_DN142_c0_g1_i39:1533-2102(-)
MQKITFWLVANKTAHHFYFSKRDKPKPSAPMSSNKYCFPICKGGFDICLPSKRTEASIVSLFFHILQHSPFHIFLLELRTAVRIINDLSLVPNVFDNSLMWAVPLECEVAISIDSSTGEIFFLCRSQENHPIDFQVTSWPRNFHTRSESNCCQYNTRSTPVLCVDTTASPSHENFFNSPPPHQNYLAPL